MLLVQPLIRTFGNTETELHQHLNVSYTKANGTKGTKMEQVITKQTINSIVDLLDQRVFGQYHKQPYVQHRLKMLLGNKMRKDVHQNLELTDAVCWTDYSKEYSATDQEECKSSAFGAGNVTIQLIGQVYELRVLKPSSPSLLGFNEEENTIKLSKPNLDGGSDIQKYKIHLKAEHQDTWYEFKTLNMKHLSQDPEIPPNLFGRLAGVFQIRVFAINLVGLGEFAEIKVKLSGDLPFKPEDYTEVSEDCFTLQYSTFYAEFFFFSDHSDAPKVFSFLFN